MCQNGKKIVLCTCAPKTIIHNKKSRRNKHKVLPEKLTWTLYRYLGSYDSGMDGMLMEPTENIGAALTYEYLLGELNTRNCFDFDYTPNYGDNLYFYGPNGFISFIYRDNKWAYDMYNCFSERTELMKKGHIRIDEFESR